MNKENEKANNLAEVLASANDTYDKNKNKKENPNLFPETGRMYFVKGWLELSYEHLYN